MKTHFQATLNHIFRENYNIIIPDGMEQHIRDIFKKNNIKLYTSHGINKTNTHRFDRLMLICSIIYAKHKGFTRTQIYNKYVGYINNSNLPKLDLFDLDEIFTCTQMQLSYEYLAKKTYLDETQYRKIKWYLDFLLEHNILIKIIDEVKYVDHAVDQHGTTSGRVYAINILFDAPATTYTIKDNEICNGIYAYKHKEHVKNLEHPEYKRICDLIHRYKLPTLEYVIEVARKKVKNGEKNKDGKSYIMEYTDGDFVLIKNKKTGLRHRWKTNKQVVSIREGIDIYKRFLETGFYFITKGINGGKYSRYYTTFSLLPKWIRELILIDDTKMIENDFTAMHNKIMYILIFRALGIRVDMLTGDSHTKISDILNITREQAKLIGLAYWNSRILGDETTSAKKNKELFEKMDELMKHEGVFDWICEQKMKNHKNMSIILLREERRIMDIVVNELIDINEPFIYCYDAICCTRNIKNGMEEILKKEMLL